MSQKKSQKQCSSTKQEYRSVEVSKIGRKKVYKTAVNKGGIMSLIIKIPASKITQKVRDMFFQRVSEEK